MERCCANIYNSSLKGCETCLDYFINVDVNEEDLFRNKPLHIASEKGHIKIIEKLIKNGTNPNLKDNSGFTPLSLAIYYNHVKCAEFLIEHGADINGQTLICGTPLEIASGRGHKRSVKMLLSYGADQTFVNCWGKTAYDNASDNIKKIFDRFNMSDIKEPDCL